MGLVRLLGLTLGTLALVQAIANAIERVRYGRKAIWIIFCVRVCCGLALVGMGVSGVAPALGRALVTGLGG